MKSLVDAQLPARLARLLADAGHDAVHTSELSAGNRTTDARVAEVADGEDRVVVTKDRDSRDGHLLSGSPRRLSVATGDITNAAAHLDAVIGALGEADSVELGPEAMIVHRRRGGR